jgi:hypothetical protein
MVWDHNTVAQLFRRIWPTASITLWTATIALLLASLFAGQIIVPLLLVSIIGTSIAGSLASVMLYADNDQQRLVLFGLLMVGLSYLQWLLLIWIPDLRMIHWVTRSWWIPAVASLSSAHILVLRRAPSRGVWFERATPWCVIVFGALLGGLAVRPVFAELPGDVYLLLLLPAALGALVGSLVAYGRFWREHVGDNRAGRAVGGLLRGLSYVIIFVSGLYLGRITTAPVVHFPSTLAGMSRTAIEAQLQEDLPRLRILCAEVDHLHSATEYVERVLRNEIDEGRTYYKPSEEDRVLAVFQSYRALRIGLLRTMSDYAGFEAVENPDTQTRCFLMSFAASAQMMHLSLELVRDYGDRAMVRAKLNEEARGVRAGEFDAIEDELSSRQTTDHFMAMAAHFEKNIARWKLGNAFPPQDMDWIEARSRAAISYVKANRIDTADTWARMALRRAKQDLRSTTYSAQMLTAQFVNDIRLVKRPARIDDLFVTEHIEPKLQPGDILLERRNWYLKNAFLPGYWPHAVMYVGTEEDLEELGILDDIRGLGEVASSVLSSPGNIVYIKPIDAYRQPAPDGRRHTVIEAISQGVMFRSVQRSLLTDYAAVLRPRLSREQIGRAIVRAFSHYGKPYDFEFDFFSADKLVCTELLYRAYEGKDNLQFPLVRLMGRDTLPADEIVRIFTRERETMPDSERRLSLIMFVDWDQEKKKLYIHTDEDIFSKSVDRPSAFME